MLAAPIESTRRIPCTVSLRLTGHSAACEKRGKNVGNLKCVGDEDVNNSGAAISSLRASSVDG